MSLRLFGFVSLAALMVASCGDRARAPAGDGPAQTEEATPRAAPTPVGVIASDAIENLSAAPTGIDFWVHPNVAFNSLVIVANNNGLASYNIEDGGVVSRVPGQALTGAAVSYIGFGPKAAGLVASFDEADGSFEFFGVDNVSRLFIPLAGAPSLRGAVRGFCMGRASTVPDPSLFVVQKGELQIFNLTPAVNGDEAAISVAGASGVTIPENVTGCAVGADGAVVVITEDGGAYRLAESDAFDAPLATVFTKNADEIGLLTLSAMSGDDAAGNEAADTTIAVFDRENAMVEFSNAQGLSAAIQIDSSFDIDAPVSPTTMAISTANLGGVYRNGAIAMGVNGEAPSVAIIPLNGAINAIEAALIPAVNPRGQMPSAQPESDLIITPEISFED